MPCSLHPREDVRRRPVATQPDLHEVAPGDRAAFDEPPHRRAVAGQTAPILVGGVGVRVEVDDADVPWRADLGDGTSPTAR